MGKKNIKMCLVHWPDVTAWISKGWTISGRPSNISNCVFMRPDAKGRTKEEWPKVEKSLPDLTARE